MVSLKKLAIRGTLWVVATYGVSIAWRFGSNLLLTRLLDPEMFGKVTLVWVAISTLFLFSDFGIAPCIIQSKRGDDPDFLNTAWTIQVVRGLLIWLGCFLVAYPVSWFYQQPEFLILIPFVGFCAVIDGFDTTKRVTLNRHLSMGYISLLEIGSQLISGSIVLVWAWLSPSIWTIAASGTIAAVVSLILNNYCISGSGNRFAWDKESAKEILSFGKWVFASSAMHFLANQSDRLILGRLFNLALFGIYGLAFAIADLPNNLINKVSSSVIFPSFAKIVDLPRQTIRSKVQKGRELVLYGIALMLALLVSGGDIIVSILYDERYQQAGWMLSILALGVWPLALTNTLGPALLALGKAQYSAAYNFLSFVFLLVGIPLGFHLFGEVGAVVAVSLSNLPIYGVTQYGLCREKLSCIAQDLRTTTIFVIILILCLAGRVTLGLGLPTDSI